MKVIAIPVLAFAIACAGAVASSSTRAAVTPLQKVITLLQSMDQTGVAALVNDRNEFFTYKLWCDNICHQKRATIEDETNQIEQLEADIEELQSAVDSLTGEIAVHDDDIQVWNGDKTAATKVRAIDNTDYLALHKDYTESVYATTKAKETLQAQNYIRAQAFLLQLNSSRHVPNDDKHALTSLLQTVKAVSAMEPRPGYEFQSQSVIDLLVKLQDKFTTALSDTESEEQVSKASYEQLIATLDDQIGTATSDRNTKSQTKMEKLQTIADKKGQLGSVTDDRTADQNYLTDTTATCEQKAADYIDRAELRKEEIRTIRKALAAIQEGTAAAATLMPVFVQKDKKGRSALVQLESFESERQNEDRYKLESYLTLKAEQLHSRVLSAVATHAGKDPLRKVKKMIKDLIYKLVQEANEEATHKGWCDTELATNGQTRKEKTEGIESLHATMDELEASITKLTEDKATLTSDLAFLEETMVNTTEIRRVEKLANEQAIIDARKAQFACETALKMLRDFYAKAAESTAFIQIKKADMKAKSDPMCAGTQFACCPGSTIAKADEDGTNCPEPPEFANDKYTGKQGEGKGVVDMLELLQEDFARL